MPQKQYWKKFFGIEVYKIQYYLKWSLYRFLRIKLPKLKDQRSYWEDRGTVYMNEIRQSGYLEREIFFQDLLILNLKRTNFDSFFEAGCGFGWNIGRVKDDFPNARVGGLDFSHSQLLNGKEYLSASQIHLINGDNCHMPLKDNAFDIGFSLGVFMNIHPSKIKNACREMTRVCRKKIIHIEYDQNHTTPELKEKREFKTNIVSHDYFHIYASLGKKISEFYTYQDFGDSFHEYAQKCMSSSLDRWEGFEGPEKYILIVVDV